MNLVPMPQAQVAAHRKRVDDARQGTYLRMPEQHQADAPAIIRRLSLAERRLAAPRLSRTDYRNGVAKYPDQQYVRPGQTGIVISTEHATVQQRMDPGSSQRKVKKAEPGLAGLGATVAETLDATHITMLGQQTGDANNDLSHPYKEHLLDLLKTEQAHTFISLHGMSSTHVADLNDDRVFDVLLGIGSNPETRTLQLANRLIAVARQYGLKIGLNQHCAAIRREDKRYFLLTRNDGSLGTDIFQAPPRTTRGTVEGYSREYGWQIAAIQIELASHLRIIPKEAQRPKDHIGPALAYLALLEALTAWMAHENGLISTGFEAKQFMIGG